MDVKRPDVEDEGQGERENCPENGDVPAQDEASDDQHEAEDQDDGLLVLEIGVVKHCWWTVLATVMIDGSVEQGERI